MVWALENNLVSVAYCSLGLVWVHCIEAWLASVGEACKLPLMEVGVCIEPLLEVVVCMQVWSVEEACMRASVVGVPGCI